MQQLALIAVLGVKNAQKNNFAQSEPYARLDKTEIKLRSLDNYNWEEDRVMLTLRLQK